MTTPLPIPTTAPRPDLAAPGVAPGAGPEPGGAFRDVLDRLGVDSQPGAPGGERPAGDVDVGSRHAVPSRDVPLTWVDASDPVPSDVGDVVTNRAPDDPDPAGPLLPWPVRPAGPDVGGRVVAPTDVTVGSSKHAPPGPDAVPAASGPMRSAAAPVPDGPDPAALSSRPGSAATTASSADAVASARPGVVDVPDAQPTDAVRPDSKPHDGQPGGRTVPSRPGAAPVAGPVPVAATATPSASGDGSLVVGERTPHTGSRSSASVAARADAGSIARTASPAAPSVGSASHPAPDAATTATTVRQAATQDAVLPPPKPSDAVAPPTRPSPTGAATRPQSGPTLEAAPSGVTTATAATSASPVASAPPGRPAAVTSPIASGTRPAPDVTTTATAGAATGDPDTASTAGRTSVAASPGTHRDGPGRADLAPTPQPTPNDPGPNTAIRGSSRGAAAPIGDPAGRPDVDGAPRPGSGPPAAGPPGRPGAHVVGDARPADGSPPVDPTRSAGDAEFGPERAALPGSDARSGDARQPSSAPVAPSPVGETPTVGRSSASTAPDARPEIVDGRLATVADQVRRAEVQRLAGQTNLGVDVVTEQLGTVRIEAAAGRGELQMNLASDDAGARATLVERLPELREQLRESGVDLTSLDVTARDGRYRDASGRQPAASSGDATSTDGERTSADGLPDESHADAGLPGPPSADGRVDLRL